MNLTSSELSSTYSDSLSTAETVQDTFSHLAELQNQIVQDSVLAVHITEFPEPGWLSVILGSGPFLVAIASAVGAYLAYSRANKAEKIAKRKVRFSEVIGDLRIVRENAEACNQAALKYIQHSGRAAKRNEQGDVTPIPPGSHVESALTQRREVLFDSLERLRKARSEADFLLPNELKEPVDSYIGEVNSLVMQNSLLVNSPEAKAQKLDERLEDLEKSARRYMHANLE